MIILKADDESALIARLEKILGDDVTFYQSDTEAYTEEELQSITIFNAKQQRIYLGRVERNTRRIEEDLRHLTATLLPLADFAAYALSTTEHSSEEIQARVKAYNDVRRN